MAAEMSLPEPEVRVPPPPHDGLALLAAILGPAGRDPAPVALVEDAWRVPVPPDLGRVFAPAWGRAPLPARSDPVRSFKAAIARERAIARARRAGDDVVRLPPSLIREAGVRGSLRRFVRGGAVVVPRAAGERVVDVIARAAGLTDAPVSIRAGAGGAVLARAMLPGGAAVMLRAGFAGGPSDPSRGAAALQRLSTVAAGLAPVLVGRGVVHGIAWSVETLVAGRRPGRLTRRLVDLAAVTSGRLPRADGPPRAFDDDLVVIASMLPGRAQDVVRLRAAVRPVLAPMPACWRHGDLWLGNVIEQPERIVCVDWDAWHDAGVPGTDLVHLIATEQRRRAHIGIGAAWRARVWRTASFEATVVPLLQRSGAPTDDASLEAIGVAWWASAVAGTLARLPSRAADGVWLEANVDPVLSLP